MNKERMYAVADAIEREQQHFNMDSFCQNEGTDSLDVDEAPKTLEEVHKCGTMMCVAGWGYFLFKDLVSEGAATDFEATADEALELTYDQSHRLYYGVGVGFGPINRNKDKVPAALRWMADTGTVDWKSALTAVGVPAHELELGYSPVEEYEHDGEET